MSKLTLPTLEELKGLPQWANVAFAARCVSHVVQLLINSRSNEFVSFLFSDETKPLSFEVEFAEHYAIHNAVASTSEFASKIESAINCSTTTIKDALKSAVKAGSDKAISVIGNDKESRDSAASRFETALADATTSLRDLGEASSAYLSSSYNIVQELERYLHIGIRRIESIFHDSCDKAYDSVYLNASHPETAQVDLDTIVGAAISLAETEINRAATQRLGLLVNAVIHETKATLELIKDGPRFRNSLVRTSHTNIYPALLSSTATAIEVAISALSTAIDSESAADNSMRAASTALDSINQFAPVIAWAANLLAVVSCDNIRNNTRELQAGTSTLNPSELTSNLCGRLLIAFRNDLATLGQILAKWQQLSSNEIILVLQDFFKKPLFLDTQPLQSPAAVEQPDKTAEKYNSPHELMSSNSCLPAIKCRLRDLSAGPFSAGCGFLAGLVALATGFTPLWVALPCGVVLGWLIADRSIAATGM